MDPQAQGDGHNETQVSFVDFIQSKYIVLNKYTKIYNYVSFCICQGAACSTLLSPLSFFSSENTSSSIRFIRSSSLSADSLFVCLTCDAVDMELRESKHCRRLFLYYVILCLIEIERPYFAWPAGASELFGHWFGRPATTPPASPSKIRTITVFCVRHCVSILRTAGQHCVGDTFLPLYPIRQ